MKRLSFMTQFKIDFLLLFILKALFIGGGVKIFVKMSGKSYRGFVYRRGSCFFTFMTTKHYYILHLIKNTLYTSTG